MTEEQKYIYTPKEIANIISIAKVAMDIIADVTCRTGRHASYITPKLLNKNQYCHWIGAQDRIIEIVTDGIGVFIAKTMYRLRSLMAGTVTEIKLYKFTNERNDGNYIFASVSVNGISLLSDGMTDFSGAGSRAYEDLSAVLKLWAWLYNVDIVFEQLDHTDYQHLMVNMQKMYEDNC